MQQHFDYSDDSAFNDLAMELDHLNTMELSAVQQALEQVRKDSATQRMEHGRFLFENGILPVLKNWAQLSYATLDIQEQPDMVFQVTLTSQYGFDYKTDKWVRHILAGADYISTEVFEEKSVLIELVFDFNKE